MASGPVFKTYARIRKKLVIPIETATTLKLIFY